MAVNIYVGNLNYGVQEDDLKGLFSKYGEVQSAKVIVERDTGRNRGFGFVVMEDEKEAVKAIEGLDGLPFMDRNLRVNRAKDKEDNRSERRDNTYVRSPRSNENEGNAGSGDSYNRR